MNLKIVITAPKRQKLEEGNEQSRGLEENKERHERNLRFEHRVLNILHWLLQNGHLKLIDSLTFSFSVLWFFVCKAETTIELHQGEKKKKMSSEQLLQPKHSDAAEMKMKKEKKTPNPAWLFSK